MKDNLVGEIIESLNYGRFKVIEFTYSKKRHKYYKIKFLDTGYKTISSRSNIVKGLVKDYFRPTIFNVAYRGNKEVKNKIENYLYDRWYAILCRIYDKNHSHYHAYGGKGVTISKSWHCFENFYNDIKLLDGYNEQLLLNGEIELDKDFKQGDVENKIYSKETCIWINRTINNRKQSSKQRKFKATSPNNDTYYHDNIREFGRIHNVSNNVIRYSLKNNNTTKNGWKFEYCQEDEKHD